MQLTLPALIVLRVSGSEVSAPFTGASNQANNAHGLSNNIHQIDVVGNRSEMDNQVPLKR